MNEFEEISIVDLDEDMTREVPLEKDKMRYAFLLSQTAPLEWVKIFIDEYHDVCLSRKHWLDFPPTETKAQRVRFISASMTHISITAKERELKGLLKIANKIIERTNRRYPEKLKEQARSKEKVSSLRDRLFHKKRG